ncbi:hypothetical protein EVAR_77093_1 [Eumeta japonica]|uniref:Uncharacterized protein n=1 Tax=Eumeta variegata TaxID=151549 RepID=A0A4C1T543_EUMVA|nr:hypothetical protein EVAR_77093_1 [Eumeta japonica]
MVGGFLQCGGVVNNGQRFFLQTLLSRALQDDGWLGTVGCTTPTAFYRHALAPLAPETPISGRAVTTAAFKAYHWSSPPKHDFDTEQPSLQLTPARRSRSGTPQNATSRLDVHHTNLVVRTRGGLLILPRGHEYRGDDESTISTMSPSAGARHIGVAAPAGTRVGGYSSTTSPEVIGEALTRAPVCRPEEHVVVKWLAGSAAGAPDQEVVRREASARQVRCPPPSTVWS